MAKTTKEAPPTPQMIRAGKLLAAEILKRGWSKSEFGRLVDGQEGLKSGYQNVRNWVKGRGFSGVRQRMCARLLELPATYFDEGTPEPALKLLGPGVRHPALARLLDSRQLRQFTIDALLALDKTHEGYPDDFWADQADVHEGIAARNESKARLSLAVRPGLAPATKRKK